MTIPKHPAIMDYIRKSPSPCLIEGGLRVQDRFNKKPEPDKPIVSIITVVYNGGKNLDQTIQSVLNQTYDNIEYLIIDGASTDGTLGIIRTYEDRIAYWLSEPDKGIGDAFNKGIALSTGDIIGIINADDWYSVDAVETIVREYKRYGDCIYHAKLQYWDLDMNPYYVFSGDDKKILKRGTINHPTVFVPRKIYEAAGIFNIAFKNAMDYEWLIRAKLQGIGFCYIDRIISNMRLEGASDKKWLNNYIEIFRARNFHGIHYLTNSLLFIEMVIITVFRKSLEYIGLHGVVRTYRKYFSITKKETL